MNVQEGRERWERGVGEDRGKGVGWGVAPPKIFAHLCKRITAIMFQTESKHCSKSKECEAELIRN